MYVQICGVEKTVLCLFYTSNIETEALFKLGRKKYCLILIVLRQKIRYDDVYSVKPTHNNNDINIIV